MEILEVSAKEYAEIISTPYQAFGSVAFNDLNKDKCEEVYYLLFREGKYRLGIIGGYINKIYYSPFSAPFGGFSFISSDIRLQYIEEAVRLLKTWATQKRFTSISITLPPQIYETNFITKQLNCLWRENFEISKIDLNYSFNLDDLKGNYIESLWHNARKNLRIAMNSQLQFCKCNTEKENELAYEIICKNRESRGFPLRMNWQQVFDTVRIIPADFFLINNEKQLPIASAIVFHVSQTIVQVIYWGNLQDYSEMKPMNFLAFKLFEYYQSCGRNIVDIGPSTENSIPNYGLVEFKESIGCFTSLKLTLKYLISEN